MRKGRWMLALLMTLCLLGACDYHEMDNMVHVVGLGIEKTQEGKYKVSAEIVSLEKNSDGAFTPQVATATGNTAMEATSNIRGLISKRLNFSHCQVIVFDEMLAREGIGTLVDSLVQFNEIDINTYCMVSVGCTPSEVLATEALTARTQSFELRSTLVDAVGYQRAAGASLLWLYNNIHENAAISTLPIMYRTPMGEKVVVDLRGAAVFASDQMVGVLSREETQFYLVGIGIASHRAVSIPAPEGYHSIQISGTSTTLEAEVVDGRVEVSFEVGIQIAFLGRSLNNKEPGEIGEEIKAYFRDGILALIARGWNELDCDLFRIAAMLYRQYPDQKETVADWEADVRAGRSAVNVTVDLQSDEALKGD